MKITAFEQQKLVNDQIQLVTTYQVDSVDFFKAVKLDEIVKYPAAFKDLLVKWLNDHQITVLSDIKKESLTALELARVEALNEAESFVTTEKPAVTAFQKLTVPIVVK